MSWVGFGILPCQGFPVCGSLPACRAAVMALPSSHRTCRFPASGVPRYFSSQACARRSSALLGLLTQRQPQKRGWLRDGPEFRIGFCNQADLTSSCRRTYLAGLLRSTGITPFPRYYEPRRLPTRAGRAVMYSRKPLDRSPPGRVSQVPDRSVGTRCPQPPRRARQVRIPVTTLSLSGFTRYGRLATPICLTRPNRVQCLRLAPSPREAPHPGLLRRTLARLHVERAIHKASSFQLARPAKLRLTHHNNTQLESSQ